MSTEPTKTEEAAPGTEVEQKVAEQNAAAKDAADTAAAEAKEAAPVTEEVKAEDPPAA